MATQPDPASDGAPPPDIIEPQSPPETPTPANPAETPAGEPPEIAPQHPDFDHPDGSPPELPPVLYGPSKQTATAERFSTETGNYVRANAGQVPASMIEL